MKTNSNNQCLHFFTYNVTTLTTGGEIYNAALLESARIAGWECSTYEQRTASGNALTKLVKMLTHIARIDPKHYIMIDFGCLHSFAPAIIFNLFFRRKKMIAILHHYSYWDVNSPIRKAYYSTYARLLSRHADILFTNSEFSQSEFYHYVPNRNPPSFIVPPFVDGTLSPILSPKSHHEGIFHFLHVGTIQRRKNIHTVLAALAKLALDFRFDVVGKIADEEYMCELKQLLTRLNMTDKVHFHGRMEQEALNDIYMQADLFILVSQMEGYGMVYTDAMRFGLPIIASNQGAIPEVVHDGVNGILCEPNDVTSIANSINKILTAPEIFKTMKEINRNQYRFFLTRDAFLSRYREIFTNIALQTI